MAEANPETGAITDEESARAHIAGLLSEPDGPTEPEEEPEANQPEPEAVQETKDTSESETEEAEPESEGEELPDSIEGLAEALGFDPSEFSEYLKVPVKIGGKSEQVTLSEAIKGYQLESDYRQKTAEISEHRRELEAKTSEIAQRWQQRFQQLDGAMEAAAAILDGGPSAEELERLLDEDPIEYSRAKARHDKNMEKLQKAFAEKQRLQSEWETEQQQETANRRATEQQRLVEAVPDLSDPLKLSKFERNVSEYLTGLGFPMEQIGEFFASAFDHRQVLILRDAMRFRAMEAGKKELPKKLKAVGRVAKPNALPNRAQTDQDKLAAGKDRLRRLRTRGSKQQQDQAAVDYVKGLL